MGRCKNEVFAWNCTTQPNTLHVAGLCWNEHFLFKSFSFTGVLSQINKVNNSGKLAEIQIKITLTQSI